MRQKNLLVFDFEEGESEEIISYIKHNMDFIRNHCLVFHFNIDLNFEGFLKENEIDFFQVHNEHIFQQHRNKKHNPNLSPLEAKAQSLIEPRLINQNLQKLIDSLPQDKSALNQQNSIPKKIKITFDSVNSDKIITQPMESQDAQDLSIQSNEKDSQSSVLETDSTFQETQTQNSLSQDLNNQLVLQYGNNVTYSKALPYLLFQRAIRSGEELNLHAHATFLKSINVGAVIKTSGNLQIYGKCDGILESFGDYIIIKECCAGRISLQGVNLERKMLKEFEHNTKLKILTVENGMIQIAEL
ncbi:hypothetical protein [Helicobacter didelphidarum]|nr:hypothetical protein [Helicobacter didelphidarum]